MNKLYIYGASGHGFVVADIARECGYEEIIYIDDGENSYPSFDEIKEENHIPLAFGIGVNATRKKLFQNVIKYGFDVVNLIHPSAILSSTVTLGIGIVIMPNVVVNTLSHIGDGVILNTSCVIEHENNIGDFVHISPNTALAGEVTIKENTHIGIGSSIIQGITIGKNCIICAGSVVVKNIGNNKLCYGNPCKIIKEL
jgi:UDP-N-acetylbacillosamine N-acetyltransferase